MVGECSSEFLIFLFSSCAVSEINTFIFIEESLWLLYFCDLIFYTIVYFYREGFNWLIFFKGRFYL
jgi:hypothetical protein